MEGKDNMAGAQRYEETSGLRRVCEALKNSIGKASIRSPLRMTIKPRCEGEVRQNTHHDAGDRCLQRDS